MSHTAYPLSWPLGRVRTADVMHGRFDTSFANARDGLMYQLSLMGAENIVLSTNIELRRDGLPYAQRRQPADTGVAVYFTWKNQQYAFACDCWLKVEHNLQAIHKTVEAIRGISRWGTGEMMVAAFAGFKALPETTARAWWEVLGVPANASPQLISTAYKSKAKQAHPDVAGGSHEQMQELNAARDAGLNQ